ncbi:MAG TPA: carboxypeptidase regulatory-like domain-containing protein [Candidatus Acidoferrum sp.]|nr:carboxypeptidase regulatory-like domain-containing protein [Candidatus Acidoferrum sp.]
MPTQFDLESLASRAFYVALALAGAMVCAASYAPRVLAQQGTLPPQPPPPVATISGTVHTPEQAPVPGATIRVTDLDNGKAWVSWTDETGKFELPALPIGHYRIEVSQLGFTPATQQIQTPSANPLTITLRVATLAELNGTPTAGTGSARRGKNLAGANGAAGGRSANASAGNEGAYGGSGGGRRGAPPPGVMNALRQGMGGFQQTELTGEGGASEASNGSEASESASGAAGALAGNSSDVFVLQGAVGQGATTNLPNFAGGPGEFGPEGSFIPGSPGENGGPGRGFGPGGPQFGGPGQGGPGGGPGPREGGPPPGAIFRMRGRMARQMVNRVRFTLFDRYENSVWDARPYSITGVESPKISHYTERVGGAMGGPLIIPDIYNGADRTFFFVNYQHQTSQTPVDMFSTVPTADERTGNFCNSSTPVELFDPNSNISGPRTPLGNGCQIPTINPAAEGLLAFIPLPNVPCPTGSACPTIQNYHLQATTPLNSDTVNFHVLHTINAKWNVNGGYNLNSQRIDTLGNFPDIKGTETTLAQAVSLGLTHNWTPELVESTTVNWSRNRVQVLSDNSYVNNVAGDLGITGVSTDPINFGIPAINLNDFSGLNDPVPSRVRNQTLRFGDSLTWVHAKHTFTFGGEVRRIELNQTSDPIARGQFTFTGLMTAQLDANGNPVPGTGNDFADFLIGLPYNTRTQFGDANTYFRSWGFVGFAQDDFRVNRRFTFLYGVRYEAVTPPVELFNQIANLDLNAAATAVDVVTPDGSGNFFGTYPRALVHGDYGNWAPRIGFAWQPFTFKPKTLVRGGYSIFYDESIYDTLAQQYLAYQPPFSVSRNLFSSATQVLTLQNGFPASGPSNLPTCSPEITTNCTPISNTAGVNPNYKVAYAQLWSLGTETELTHTWLLDLTYTGTKGTNLDLLRAPNRAPLGTNPLDTQNLLQIPYATSFYYDQTGANSIYNALQVRLMHHFTSGLLLQAVYTFSKSLDNASTIGGTSAVVVQQDGNYAGQYGLSSFDMRHQFRLFSMYELPFGERHRYGNRGWEEKVLSNWRVLNIVTWHTGAPYTALLGGAASNNSGTGANFSERADQAGDPNIGVCGGAPLAFFNTAAFTSPPAGQYGDAQRNSIEGPCSFSWNFSVGKSFRFGPDQRRRFDARWEINNLTNTPTFTGLGTTLGSTFFGRVTSAGSMRTMDINLRFNF